MVPAPGSAQSIVGPSPASPRSVAAAVSSYWPIAPGNPLPAITGEKAVFPGR